MLARRVTNVLSIAAMDARTYLKNHSAEAVEQLALLSGTTLAYFKQIAYGARKPSPELAKRIAENSRGLIHRGELRADLWGEEVPKAETDTAA